MTIPKPFLSNSNLEDYIHSLRTNILARDLGDSAKLVFDWPLENPSLELLLHLVLIWPLSRGCMERYLAAVYILYPGVTI